MSNQERPRVQAARAAQEKVPNTTDLTHADWGRLDEVWNQLTVVDDKAKAPTTPNDTHDAAVMFGRAQVGVGGPYLGDKVAARVYAPEEPEADQADLPTEEATRPSFTTGDAPTEDTPFALGNYLGHAGPRHTPSPWDSDTAGFAGDGATIDRVPSTSRPLHIERVGRPSFVEPEQSPDEPIASGSIGDPANMIAARASEPRSETIAIAPRRPGPSSNWLGRAAQAITSTAKRWGQRLGLLGAVASSTIYAPESQKPITVPQSAPPVPEQIVPAPQPVEAQAPLVTNGTPPENLPARPVAEDSRAQIIVTPAPAVADVTPQKVSVRLPDVGTPRRPSVQTRDAEPAKPLVPLKVRLGYGDSVAPAAPIPAAVTAEPTPATPPAPVVDASQPAADSMSAVQQPPSSVEVSKQLNQDISRGSLSPEKQIEYIKNLFDTLDASKIFIRLSPTRLLELRQYSTGEIQARFPGEKDFRVLTAEEIKGLGDLTKKPHYSR